MHLGTHQRPEMADGIDSVELGNGGLCDIFQRLSGWIGQKVKMKARHMRIFVDRLWIKQGIVWHRILGQSPLPIDRIFTHRPSTTRGFLPQAVDYGESIKDSFQTLGTSDRKCVVWGNCESVRVDIVGRLIIKKKKK